MKFLFSLYLFLLFTFTAFTQIRFEVNKIPANTPPNATIFITGTFNNWQPADSSYQLKKATNGSYFVVLKDTVSYFEYKFTQGNWGAIEGTTKNQQRANRVYDYPAGQGPSVIMAQIDGWETPSSYTFIIKTIPTNTPHDATLYLVGNFNDWNPEAADYKFKKQPDGTYLITIFSSLPKIEYKITRGGWGSVEGRDNGKARTNRFVYRLPKSKHQTTDCDVASWEDLAGNTWSVFDFLLVLSAFQGLLLIIAITTIHDYNRVANRFLIALIGITSIALLARATTIYRDVFHLYPKLILIPDFIFFLFAPTFYLYIQRLLTLSDSNATRWKYHYIPAILQFFVYLPLFLMEYHDFTYGILDRTWTWLFASLSTIAFFSNLYYWYLSQKVVQTYKKQYSTSNSYEQNLQYLNTALFIMSVCLCLWFFMCVMVCVNWFFDYDTIEIVEKSTDAIWLAFAATLYFLGYIAIHQPEVFRIPAQVTFLGTVQDEPSNPKTKTQEMPDENIQLLKAKIEAYMQRNKPHINPRLTLNDLADKLKIQPHTVSKVINDGFNKNFFDFINSYRIEEFKGRMTDPKFKNFTLLSIAFDCGFNSKTAFNRSFKKLTNQTPKEYYNVQD
jgi:AraC-like DNA-binding protein